MQPGLRAKEREGSGEVWTLNLGREEAAPGPVGVLASCGVMPGRGEGSDTGGKGSPQTFGPACGAFSVCWADRVVPVQSPGDSFLSCLALV